MNDILILADGSTMEIETWCNLRTITSVFPNEETMLEASKKFTPENLKSVQITNAEGSKIAQYNNLVLNHTGFSKEGGSVLGIFSLRQKTQMELDIEELKADMQALNETVGGAE